MRKVNTQVAFSPFISRQVYREIASWNTFNCPIEFMFDVPFGHALR
jgi:hypothetical protein